MHRIPGILGVHGLTVKVLRFDGLTMLPIASFCGGDDGAMNISCRLRNFPSYESHLVFRYLDRCP
jgi:hypothetical protein